MIEPCYLGIDLGTSSIKAIVRTPGGATRKARQVYSRQSPDHWCDALAALLKDLTADLPIAAIGLSAQVGTYLVNDRHVIHWQSDAGKEELTRIKSQISQQRFLSEISMPHPDLISYPLPRLLYIQNHYGPGCQVMMPKDLLIRELTGQTVTDIYSMRGIADPNTGRYATALMEDLDIHASLPPLKKPTDLAGYVTEEAASRFHLPVGTPVYLGCNDFFAGLLGMGICNIGDTFDLTGTSEHIGYISRDIQSQAFVSGNYFMGNCTYGGTKASGSSCDLAIRNFGVEGLSMEDMLAKDPPIFLPYLQGERAPIFDEKAQGVYFGIHPGTDHAALAYATLEGVALSLYHIAHSMQMPRPEKLICGGGAAGSSLLNTLKATLLDCPVVTATESDTSALGACMMAMIGNGCYRSYEEAVQNCVRYSQPILPRPQYRQQLLDRFSVYQQLYPQLKPAFHHFYEIKTERKSL